MGVPALHISAKLYPGNEDIINDIGTKWNGFSVGGTGEVDDNGLIKVLN